jgi:hypothetical protein
VVPWSLCLHPFREILEGWRFFIFGQNKEKPAVLSIEKKEAQKHRQYGSMEKNRRLRSTEKKS